MSASRSRTSKRALATEAWRLMAEFASANFRRRAQTEQMRKLGMTPAHYRALSMLDPNEPRPMRAMADGLACDASMATWLVDRLEERGLVERRTPPNDRRVKTIVLTARGIKTREMLRESFWDPPQELVGLDIQTLETLNAALKKLPRRGQGEKGC